MTIKKRLFGHTKDGVQVDGYTMVDGGMSVEVITYGAAISSLVVPTAGGVRDVALGFDDVPAYERHASYLGAIIGRVANRIGGAQFSLGGRIYELDKNTGSNCLHGGYQGFDRQVWSAKAENDALVLSLHESDMKCGFPGSLDVDVRYCLKDGALSIGYVAVCDADTPINLTNHCYFNLGGHDHGSIENHNIRIYADSITPIDESLIPTGEVLDVAGTPLDLREPTRVGRGLDSSHPQIVLGGGYDHNYVLSREVCRELSPAAVLEYDGLRMTCMTTKPGIQFYSGNFLSGDTGKEGAIYAKRSGLCLETQYWPDSLNKPEFPDSTLRKGATYTHETVYKFLQM